MSELIFVSSPYSHPDKAVEEKRYQDVMTYVAKLMNAGKFVFSPIVHCHQLALTHALPTDWEYWGNYCNAMLERSTTMHVLMLDGWQESKGVGEEIKSCKKLKVNVYYTPAGDSDVDSLKTSEEWAIWAKGEFGIQIMDPDGWDRKNYDYSFKEELIDLAEFKKRVMMSTCLYPSGSKEKLF